MTSVGYDLGTKNNRWNNVYANVFDALKTNTADFIFANGMRMTEADKLGYNTGIAFLDPTGNVIFIVDNEGNILYNGILEEKT